MTRAHPPGKKRSTRARTPKASESAIDTPPVEVEADAPLAAAPAVPDPQQFVHSAEGFWKAAGRFGRLR